MPLIFAISWQLLVTSGSPECAAIYVHSTLSNCLPCCKGCSWLVLGSLSQEQYPTLVACPSSVMFGLPPARISPCSPALCSALPESSSPDGDGFGQGQSSCISCRAQAAAKPGSLSLSRAGGALQLGGRKAAQTRGASPHLGLCAKGLGAELRASRKACPQLSSVGQGGPQPTVRCGMGHKCPFSSAAALQGQRGACKEPSATSDSRAWVMWAG